MCNQSVTKGRALQHAYIHRQNEVPGTYSLVVSEYQIGAFLETISPPLDRISLYLKAFGTALYSVIIFLHIHIDAWSNSL